MRLTLASIWRRTVARLIDLALMSALVVAVLFLLHLANLDTRTAGDVVIVGVLISWEVLLTRLWNGRTPGKWAMGLVLVHESLHGAATMPQLLGRLICRVCLFAFFAVFITYELEAPVLIPLCILEGLALLLTKRRQTLADLVGRTAVAQIRGSREIAPISTQNSI